LALTTVSIYCATVTTIVHKSFSVVIDNFLTLSNHHNPILCFLHLYNIFLYCSVGPRYVKQESMYNVHTYTSHRLGFSVSSTFIVCIVHVWYTARITRLKRFCGKFPSESFEKPISLFHPFHHIHIYGLHP